MAHNVLYVGIEHTKCRPSQYNQIKYTSRGEIHILRSRESSTFVA